MLNNKSKERYDEIAVKVFKGKLGFQPAPKSRYSRSGGDKFKEMGLYFDNTLSWWSYLGW